MFKNGKNKSTIIILLVSVIALFFLLYTFGYKSNVSNFTNTNGEKYKLTQLSYLSDCKLVANGQLISKCPATLYKYDDYITITDDKILINDGKTATYEIIKKEVNDGNEIYHIGNVNVNLIKNEFFKNYWNEEYNELSPNTVLYRYGNKLSTADNSFSLTFTNLD